MKRAALGIRMHSGWGVLVAISFDSNSPELLDRRRLAAMDSNIAGAKQPYHHAASLLLPDAEKHIAKCAAASERMALAGLIELLRELNARHYRVVGSAVLLASGRALPPLAKILTAHPLLHTAEGEFFRNAAKHACERLKIPVTPIRERDLDAHFKTAFERAASRLQRKIADLGRTVGPPWTKDHKTAALAASTLLASKRFASPPVAHVNA
jgi:hypothetical protein